MRGTVDGTQLNALVRRRRRLVANETEADLPLSRAPPSSAEATLGDAEGVSEASETLLRLIEGRREYKTTADTVF